MSHCQSESCCSQACCHQQHHCHHHCHCQCHQKCSCACQGFASQQGSCGCQKSQCCSQGCGCQKSQCSSQGCGCQKNCHCNQGKACQCESCTIKREEEERCEHAYELLEVADEAWLEVLKEKLMERIRSSDSKIDQLADIVAETNHARWQNKMSEEQCVCDFEQKLKDVLKQHHQESSGSNPGQQNESQGKGMHEGQHGKQNSGYTKGYGQQSTGGQG